MSENGRPPYPHVCQISVSDGGVPKRPVLEAVITKAGVEGDRQQNLKFHGGPDRAVCLYSLELIERLQDEGHSIDAGSSGENLTISGLEWEKLKPGDRTSGWARGPDRNHELYDSLREDCAVVSGQRLQARIPEIESRMESALCESAA